MQHPPQFMKIKPNTIITPKSLCNKLKAFAISTSRTILLSIQFRHNFVPTLAAVQEQLTDELESLSRFVSLSASRS